MAAGDRRGDPARRRGGASPDRSRRRPLGVAPEPALPGRVPLGRTVDRAPAHPPGGFADGLRDPLRPARRACRAGHGGAPGTPPAALRGLPEIVGFAADEALLPEEDGGHPGLRLLAEYFAFPDKFHFFDLPLSGALADGQTLYLYLVFDRAPTARLHLQAEDFQLGCAPAINLFPRTSEPLRPDGTRSEYRLVADSHRENSVEIHSIRAVRSVAGSTVQPVPAYYGCRHDSHLGTLYWHARRIAGLTPNRLGSDLLLSLVDTGFDPLREAPAFSLTAELLCTNRYLAERLGAGTALGFERPGPVAAARLRNAPSAQSQPRLDGQSRWRLVSQLTLNHLSLVEGPRALEALRKSSPCTTCATTPAPAGR